MAKQVILAVAGAGKTYHICHMIDPLKKNLILAYTHENINNIKRELTDAYGSVPELTNVMTFDSFIYRYMLCPYEPSILKFFGQEALVSTGITTMDPPPMQIKNKSGKRISNPKYKKKDSLEHYMTTQKQYYCATISELIMYVKQGRESLIKRVGNKLNCFYDKIMIDEFQDFREHDFELITAMAKQVENVLLVGDYYQHSVSAVNNSGKPFENRKGEVSYAEFVAMLQKEGFTVDFDTLKKSRRCSKNICDYVQEKLGIEIESCEIHDGQVVWADDNPEKILEDPSITKLVYQKAADYTFEAFNWSYSKGNTVDNACVILTDKFEKLGEKDFNAQGIPISTINKLYVALTRSRGNLYLIKASTFKKLKKKYEIK